MARATRIDTGAAITRASVAAMAALDGSNLDEGQTCYVETLKATFTLMRSTAAEVSQLRINVENKAGFQWVRRLERNSVWEAQADWVIDPQNVSGLADDENTGLTGAPLLTYTEMSLRWAHADISQTTTVRVMSSQQTTDRPEWTFTCDDAASPIAGLIIFKGDLTEIYSGTVTTYTAGAAAPSTDNGDTILDSSLPVSWTASGLLADAVLLKRTNSTPVYAWVAADKGSKTARVSRPWDGSVAEATFSNGDTFKAYTIPTLLRHRFTNLQAQNAIVFTQFNMAAPLTYPRPGIATFSNCWYSVAGFFQPASIRGCVFAESIAFRGYSGSATMSIGSGNMVRGNGRLIVSGISDVDANGRLVVQGGSAAFIVHSNAVVIYNSGDVALYDTTAEALQQNYYGRMMFFGGAICGNNNSGASAVACDRWSQLTYQVQAVLADAGTFIDATPFKLGDDHYAVADIPQNKMAVYGIGIYRTE